MIISRVGKKLGLLILLLWISEAQAVVTHSGSAGLNTQVFTVDCAGCHTTVNGFPPSSGYSWDDPAEAALHAAQMVSRINLPPDNPSPSCMPLGGCPLDPAKVALIEQWHEDGAPNFSNTLEATFASGVLPLPDYPAYTGPAYTVVATSIMKTTATLNAGLKENGVDGVVNFSYRRVGDTTWIESTESRSASGTGGDNAFRTVFLDVSGLTCGTDYEYRVETTGNTVLAGNQTFSTTACDILEIVEGTAVTVAMSVNGSPNNFSLQLSATGDTSDSFTWSISVQPPLGGGSAGVLGGATTNGQLKTINYTPPTDTSGSFAFTVRATGNSGFAETVVTVNVGLAPPVISQGAQAVASTPFGAPLDIGLSATDSDSSQLSWSIVTPPSNGTVDVPVGTTVSGAVKTITYTPAPNITGQTTDTFSIGVADESDHLDTIDITVNIIPDNVLVGYIRFSAQQAGATGFYVAQSNGVVTVTGGMTVPPLDPDALTFDWSGTGSELLAIANINDGIFSFDPVTLLPGHFVLDLHVSQGSMSVHHQTVLTVMDNAALPAADNQFDCNGDGVITFSGDDSDCDNDGANNLADGLADDDEDGVPNYLDNLSDPDTDTHMLQNQTGDPASVRRLMTEPGLKIQLGRVARFADRHGSLVSMEDVADHGDSNGQPAADGIDDLVNIGGIFDFEITGLSTVGGSAQVVLPLSARILEGSVYRKFSAQNGWRDFSTGGGNSIASARSTNGICPAPGDSSYRSGLNAFDNCVQLTLVDGGPNDADGAANGVIRDPGGVAVIDPAPAPVQTRASDGGGGVLHPFWLLLILWGVIMTLKRRQTGN